MTTVAELEGKFHFIHITESLAAGVLKSVLQLANAQISTNHQVTIQYLQRNDTPSPHDLQSLVPLAKFELISKSNKLGLLILFFKLLLQKNYREPKTYVHAHSSWGGFITRLAGQIRDIPNLYYTPHCYSFLRLDQSKYITSLYKRIESFLANSSQAKVIACGESEAEIAIELGTPRVILGCNFVSIPNTPIRVSSTSNVKIGNVGRLTIQKNPQRLLAAKAHFPSNWQCVWFGDGDEKLRTALIQGGVLVSGWMSPDNASKVYTNLDYLVMTSDWEGMPFSLIEAMAFGVIPIIWNFRGANRIIQNGINGFIVQRVEDFANIIQELESDFVRKSSISNSAREYVIVNHNLDSISDNWPRFYDLVSQG